MKAFAKAAFLALFAASLAACSNVPHQTLAQKTAACEADGGHIVYNGRLPSCSYTTPTQVSSWAVARVRYGMWVKN